MEKNKKVTLEKLAGGIEQISGKLDSLSIKMDEKFEQVDKNFEQVDKRFDESDRNTDKKIESLARITKSGFDEVHERLDRVELKLEDHDKQFIITNVRLDNLEKGQDAIAGRLGIVEKKQVKLANS